MTLGGFMRLCSDGEDLRRYVLSKKGNVHFCSTVKRKEKGDLHSVVENEHLLRCACLEVLVSL